MRISKLCLVVCAVALSATSPTVRADDNPAQAAARAALEEQMRALDMQPAPTNAPVPAPVTPAQPAQPAVKAPAQPAVTTPPPVSNPPAMETNQSAAPAATMPTTNVPPAQPPPVAVTPSGATVQQPTNPPATTAPAITPAPRVAPVQTTKPATSSASSSGNSLFAPVPPPSGGTPAGAMPEESMPSSTASAVPTAVQVPAPAPVQSLPLEPSRKNNSAAIPGGELGLKPIVAPPLPISATQQAQLQALLEKYNSGAITPVQYQTERAKILNQSR
ncbi:MAG TPA: hypothetical protein VN784_12250 [Candidatus Limnocylindrales bacterium]|nr:hypothetical protein [Candidatus Limnocylindrales bacterium]